ncbi:hypothetical protein KNO15_12790 [Leifsonia shinshuensis]|uniref:hypothetical protein n=1 Tax=Leifsonia shinshuensis TaxID=150026 RepID=UPI001F504BA3|nr:hypothetical protein [Leifsonia shinshuensis]MCI0157570.1 hypothetical protein [Leifsonia shinshuensis]
MGLFPYESQWGDLGCNEPLIEHGENPARFFDWSSDGYPSEEEYLFWSRHICGLACLRSVLRAWSPQHGDITMFELVGRAQRWTALVREGDTVAGLYYRPFVDWVREDFGIDGAVHPDIAAEELLEHVRGGRVALASVSSEIRYPDRPNVRRGGHLVLVHRLERDRIVLHNPSGVGQSARDAELDLDTFRRFFAGRGVTLQKPG